MIRPSSAGRSESQFARGAQQDVLERTRLPAELATCLRTVEREVAAEQVRPGAWPSEGPHGADEPGGLQMRPRHAAAGTRTGRRCPLRSGHNGLAEELCASVGLDEEIRSPTRPRSSAGRAPRAVSSTPPRCAPGGARRPSSPVRSLRRKRRVFEPWRAGPKIEPGFTASGKVRAEHDARPRTWCRSRARQRPQVPGGVFVQQPRGPAVPTAATELICRKRSVVSLAASTARVLVDGALQRRVRGPVADDRRVGTIQRGSPAARLVGGRAESGTDRVGLGQVTGHALGRAAGRRRHSPRAGPQTSCPGRQLAAEALPRKPLAPVTRTSRSPCSPAGGAAPGATAPRASLGCAARRVPPDPRPPAARWPGPARPTRRS